MEAVLALRHLAGRNFEIELLAPEHALEHRPASVATPFGLGAPPPLDLQAARPPVRRELVEGELAGVDLAAHAARSRRAPVAVRPSAGRGGARPETALPGSLTFRGPADVPMVEWVLAEVARAIAGSS